MTTETRKKLKFNHDALQSLSADEQRRFEEFAQGPFQEPTHLLVHEAFREMVRQNPEAIAVEHIDEKITYKELDHLSDLLAAYLVENGVRRGDHVGLFLKRSIPMVVGILATLKVGAAYVPQDAGIAPTNQLKHIIKAASTRIILTLSTFKHLVPVPDGHTSLSIDDFLLEADAFASAVPKIKVEPDDTCFVLFTSGTTGPPNGVQVTHKNLCNILLTEPGSMGMAPGLKVSQILNISFDMAAWEILGALTHGATLIIRSRNIQEVVQRVDVVIATPSILGALNADKCQNVKFAAVAGEPCPQALAQKWSSFCTFYNSCGPTEVTIVNTMKLYKSGAHLTIGRPTPNNTVYILNEDLSPCAIGEIGEMWAGGDCVSKGYIQNGSLNKERYKPDPFLGNGMRMFRTRDLGRWSPEGELEHFGRTDDQVKIRGFRVELDSVSRAIETVHFCKQAITLKLDSRNLAAFVRPKTVDRNKVIEAVKQALPYYCVPSIVIALDEFPVTSRGKIDKRALTVLAVNAQETPQNKRQIDHLSQGGV